MRIGVTADKDKIDKLKKDTGIKTIQELIENSLALFAWAIKEKAKGHIIGSVDEKGNCYKEIILPSLERVKEV
ncbi:MAG: hypothetical protein JRJ00_00075 [Deltaproteobacteria bacterium]|nr:hypothetical protein [Deltaproteobacteria bacterium]